jgi:hypothetical protein
MVFRCRSARTRSVGIPQFSMAESTTACSDSVRLLYRSSWVSNCRQTACGATLNLMCACSHDVIIPHLSVHSHVPGNAPRCRSWTPRTYVPGGLPLRSIHSCGGVGTVVWTGSGSGHGPGGGPLPVCRENPGLYTRNTPGLLRH